MKLTRSLVLVVVTVCAAVAVTHTAVPLFVHLAGPVLANLAGAVVLVVGIMRIRSAARS